MAKGRRESLVMAFDGRKQPCPNFELKPFKPFELHPGTAGDCPQLRPFLFFQSLGVHHARFLTTLCQPSDQPDSSVLSTTPHPHLHRLISFLTPELSLCQA